MKRRPPPRAERFAEVPVIVGGYVVAVAAHTYVRMPRELATFDAADGWEPACDVYGSACVQVGARQASWAAARREWCEANLSFDEAWADSMAVVKSGDLPHWHPEAI